MLKTNLPRAAPPLLFTPCDASIIHTQPWSFLRVPYLLTMLRALDYHLVLSASSRGRARILRGDFVEERGRRKRTTARAFIATSTYPVPAHQRFPASSPADSAMHLGTPYAKARLCTWTAIAR